MNSHQVFVELKRIFNVKTIRSIATLADWDSGHVTRMRSGMQKISPSFFLKLCYVKDWTPQKMMDECGLSAEYFWGEED